MLLGKGLPNLRLDKLSNGRRIVSYDTQCHRVRVPPADNRHSSLRWRRFDRARAQRGEFPPDEADFGDFSTGRYGWVLENVVRLPKPIPFKGMLGLWRLPSAVERRVRQQLRV